MKFNKLAVLGAILLAISPLALAYDTGDDNANSDAPYLEKVYDSYFYLSLKGGIATTVSDKWKVDSSYDLKLATQWASVMHPSDKHSSCFMPELAVGYKFSDSPISMELAYAQFNSDYYWDKVFNRETVKFFNMQGNADLTAHMLLLKTYWNFYTNTNLIPYFGVTAGASLNKVNSNFRPIDDPLHDQWYHASSSKIGWVVGASCGLRYALSQNLDLNVGIDYFHSARQAIDYGLAKQENNISPFLVGSQDVFAGLVGIGVRF